MVMSVWRIKIEQVHINNNLLIKMVKCGIYTVFRCSFTNVDILAKKVHAHIYTGADFDYIIQSIPIYTYLYIAAPTCIFRSSYNRRF
ncbi:unnamed protein product [Phytomonas sp. EM1]|nr:unnamed protein product [Phytomonas sp. EM1]|eukprot:CCW64015.1 unnamed protein product [Phytomonas sp. isolate EM1]